MTQQKFGEIEGSGCAKCLIEQSLWVARWGHDVGRSVELEFIDQSQFRAQVERIPTIHGKPYADIETIYGDLSRLVVALIAGHSTQQLQEAYGKFGWGGSANVRAISLAAIQWCRDFHPEFVGRFPAADDGG